MSWIAAQLISGILLICGYVGYWIALIAIDCNYPFEEDKSDSICWQIPFFVCTFADSILPALPFLPFLSTSIKSFKVHSSLSLIYRLTFQDREEETALEMIRSGESKRLSRELSLTDEIARSREALKKTRHLRTVTEELRSIDNTPINLTAILANPPPGMRQIPEV